MRLAFKRYEETKEASGKGEAVKMMFEKNLYPFYGGMDFHKFRLERYWNEECDNVLKSHFPILSNIFKNYGCHHMKPGDKPFMMSDEFETIWTYCGLFNDSFAQRDSFLCFNYSMMT